MKQCEITVNPTLACANPLNFGADLDILEKTGIKILHLDLMDGHYVPNLCFDLRTIKAIRENYPFLLDVHLMVTDPDTYIEPLKNAGADYVSFHYDAVRFPIRLLSSIRVNGMKGGVVLNPGQPVTVLGETLAHVDFVLVMGVEPGFSGQRFLDGTIEKVKKLKDEREQRGFSYLIEVDGGVDRENTVSLLQSGADILVSGAFGVFEGKEGLERDCLAYQELVKNITG